MDIKYRVIAGLLDDLGKVEVEHGIVFAVEHHETDRVGPDLPHDLAEGHELAGALRHFHRLAAPKQPDQLDDLDVEIGAAAADRLHGGLHPFDIAAMVGAPHVDQGAKAAVEFRFVIGDVGGEIRVAAVGFQQRPIDIVAEGGGAEQGLLPVLPVVGKLAFRRRQPALIDEPRRPQRIDRGGHLVGFALDQGSLGEEHLVLDLERRQVPADLAQHRLDRPGANEGQPFRLAALEQGAAVFRRERGTDGFEIMARIEALRNRPDVFAERLAVAQIGRARQRVHLGSGVVDVELARHPISGEFQQRAECVAEHRAPTMADMHRTGGIGGDIFDIDLFARAEVAAAVILAACQDGAQLLDPGLLGQRHVDKTGTCDVDPREERIRP